MGHLTGDCSLSLRVYLSRTSSEMYNALRVQSHPVPPPASSSSSSSYSSSHSNTSGRIGKVGVSSAATTSEGRRRAHLSPRRVVMSRIGFITAGGGGVTRKEWKAMMELVEQVLPSVISSISSSPSSGHSRGEEEGGINTRGGVGGGGELSESECESESEEEVEEGHAKTVLHIGYDPSLSNAGSRKGWRHQREEMRGLLCSYVDECSGMQETFATICPFNATPGTIAEEEREEEEWSREGEEEEEEEAEEEKEEAEEEEDYEYGDLPMSDVAAA